VSGFDVDGGYLERLKQIVNELTQQRDDLKERIEEAERLVCEQHTRIEEQAERIAELEVELKEAKDLLSRVQRFADPRAPEDRDLDSSWLAVREYLARAGRLRSPEGQGGAT